MMARSSEAKMPTVQWNETAAMAAERMRWAETDRVTVMVGDEPVGRLTRADIERCRSRGNWLEAVLVRDLVQGPHDTCN